MRLMITMAQMDGELIEHGSSLTGLAGSVPPYTVVAALDTVHPQSLGATVMCATWYVVTDQDSIRRR
jgi:hypothetical protein